MDYKKVSLKVSEYLTPTQDPDSIEFHKQWDEFGALKGWMVKCIWQGSNGTAHSVVFDITSHYMRVIGDLEKAPMYIEGMHQTPEYD